MSKWLPGAALVVLVIIASMVTRSGSDDYEWDLPCGHPLPIVPDDNPMSTAKVELGRWLFYDTRLSVSGEMSCATCHRQELAFTDGRARAVGATGEIHPRGSMSLVNAAFTGRLNWANHLLDRLEIQALTPLFGETPVEMGMVGREQAVIDLLRKDDRYRKLLPRAFPNDADPYSLLNLVRAISAFARSIVSFNSDYDRYLQGQSDALSDSAVRGMELFFSERFECFHCHGGFNFTDSSTHSAASVSNVGFHNNGLYNIGGNGNYPPDNTGLYELTGQRRDMGRFKAPTLRNIAVTAPYMHDGSLASLADVLDHYARGGRLIESGPQAGDGRHNPYRSEFVTGFEMSSSERDDLLAFLAALTDQSVLTDARYADPYQP
ncbi:methanobactin export MATE transporter MbnM [Woeseia oceani]|uniref:Di-heme enzyme n=1 Tax=Woeseia oceani TaxID=1548547 RepID=A0A193LG97_9GAMM|nr:methanobactin export MATE transporter MbnM [Woeseia oceani]ANO51389.1 di-heme enzyme [Woeseia oceani]